MTDNLVKVGRLALREEGNFWNAYYALPDTMEKALFLGSIHMRFVVGNEKHKQVFMELMKSVVDTWINETIGVSPSRWDTTRAPESERAKKA